MKITSILILFINFCVSVSAQTLKYKLEIKDKSSVKISAEFPVNVSSISMALRSVNDELPNGTADLVEDLIVKNEKGTIINYEPLNDGKWKLKEYKGDKITISYKVRLGHEKYDWGGYGGIDAVSYVTNDGIYGTGYTFFIVPDIGEELPCEVTFDLPQGWNSSTPWNAVSLNKYVTSTTDDLLNNCFMLGTHFSEKIRVGDFEVLLAHGRDLRNNNNLFKRVLEKSINQYWKIFGEARILKYLIVVNSGSFTDGDAFNNSFDQVISGEVNEDGIISWGNILAHETFHLWNGISMNSSDQVEWFKEGVTEYMSVKSLYKTGLINQPLFLKKMESFHSRYWLGRNITSRGVTIRDAGKDKGRNVFLVYGGGCLMAFLMDVEIASATNSKKGIEDLLKLMFHDFGMTGKKYTYDDIFKYMDLVAGKSISENIIKYIEEDLLFDSVPYLKKCNMGITSFAEEHYIYKISSDDSVNLLYTKLFK